MSCREYHIGLVRVRVALSPVPFMLHANAPQATRLACRTHMLSYALPDVRDPHVVGYCILTGRVHGLFS